jgi:protein O-GlcNAc transferase
MNISETGSSNDGSSSHKTLTLVEALQLGIAHHQAGRLQDAEQTYRAILELEPRHPDANHNIGVLAIQVGQLDQALPFLDAALNAIPTQEQYWLTYLGALMQMNRRDAAQMALLRCAQHGVQSAAIDAISKKIEAGTVSAKRPLAKGSKARTAAQRGASQPTEKDLVLLVTLFNQGDYPKAETRAIELTKCFPNHGFGWKALGSVLRQQGRIDESLLPLQKAVQFLPQDHESRNNLGNTLKDLGRLSEAEDCYRSALKLKPNYPEAHYNLGICLKIQGHLREAVASYHETLKLKPDFAAALGNLGGALHELGELIEAEASCRRALEINPELVEAYNNLGSVLADQGRATDAETNYRRALEIRPDYAEALNNLAIVLIDKGRLSEAQTYIRQALQVKPDFFEAWNSFAVALKDQGSLDEASAAYRRVLEIKPDYLHGHSNYLFSLNYSASMSSADLLEEARQFGKIVSRAADGGFSKWPDLNRSTTLRVGFVSGDFCNHPVGYFLENVLAHLDPKRVEVIAYPTRAKADHITARLMPHFAAWTPLYDLTDEAAAQRVYDDRINVLLDLSGHTGHNRLRIFAHKPAPILASWLGYFATTGVAEIDYLLGDSIVTPPEEEGHFTETVWRLPDSYLCFTEPDVVVEVEALPALMNDHITFGCFNNLTKMGDAVVALWARILLAVPASRLLLKTRQLEDIELIEKTRERFRLHGIGAERLLLEGQSPRAQLLAAYNRVDIALDPFPYPGGTTSVEALWMGVPVLTKRGDRFLSHVGESILNNAGLSDWIAVDDQDYIAKAVAFAANPNALGALRAELREKVLASPLFDARRFARNLENALWGMWERWEPGAQPQGLVESEELFQADKAGIQYLIRSGELQRAEAYASEQIDRYGRIAGLLQLMGEVLFRQGRATEALPWLEEACIAEPNNVNAWNQRALTLNCLERYGESHQIYQKALEVVPDNPEILANLADNLNDAQLYEQALPWLERALSKDPKSLAARVNMGGALIGLKRFAEALQCLETIVKEGHRRVEVFHLYGQALAQTGEVDKALVWLREAIQLDPGHARVQSSLMFFMASCARHTPAAMFAEARRYGEILDNKCGMPTTEWSLPEPNQRLRVGVVSADLGDHPVGYFLEGLLRYLSRERIELVAYPTVPRSDALTERIKPLFMSWRGLHGMSDEDAAQCIRDDGVHILIDLSGHTAHNRLALFARRPSPVQVSWLGYFATTGVSGMNYILGDPQVTPPGEESHFTEQVWRLPETYLCFTPPDVELEVTPLPALHAGVLTFGCFNNLAKMGDAVVALWAQVLHKVPRSRLFLKCMQLGQPTFAERTRERFAAHGITSQRLLFEGAAPRNELLAAYGRVDIALDPFPYPGGTTSVEALWMGVPVLTWRGDRFLSRVGETIAHNAGLANWIADNESDYLAKVVAFTNDIEALARLRAGLRSRALASPLFNAPRFAKHFEEALWGMWERWNQGAQSQGLVESEEVLQPDVVQPSTKEIEYLVALFNAREFTKGEALARNFVQLYPALAFGWNVLGALLTEQGKILDALASFEHALTLDPYNAQFHSNLGNALRILGRYSQAEAACRRAIELEPERSGAHGNLGGVLLAAERFVEAEMACRRAVELSPENASALSNLGCACRQLGRFSEAEAYLRRAIQLQPDFVAPHSEIAELLTDLGRLYEAEEHYQKAFALDPSNFSSAVNLALMLPKVAASTNEQDFWRARYERGIREVEALPSLSSGLGAQKSDTFYLAYHGHCNCQVLESLCSLYRAKIPALTFAAPHVSELRPVGKRIRIGFVSQFLTDHTVGKLYWGLIKNLDRARFEIIVIHACGSKQGVLRRQIDQLAHRSLTLRHDLPSQRQTIADEQLDVLFYPEIGMASDTRLLAFARLAPVQVVGWGHPDTSGLDTMDYFVSATHIEPEDADLHYTERLVRLNRVPCCYLPVTNAVQNDADDRTSLGLPSHGVLYGCPQALFKFHPEFDSVLAEIANGDPDGHIVLIEGLNSGWSNCLRARWRKHFPILNEKVIFLPRLSLDRFMTLLRCVDLLLDPIHFGSGNTLYEAMIYGTPIVTWPGHFMRGRIVAGAYRQMGIPDAPIAERLADYAQLALELGRDSERRQAIREASIKAASHNLFADVRSVRDFEEFLDAAVEAAARHEKLPKGWQPQLNVNGILT